MSNWTELDKMWGKTEVAPSNGGEFTNLPDGKYQVSVDSIRLTETKQTGLPMFAWDLVVMDGQKGAGRHVFHNRVIRDENSMKYAKQDFVNLGINANSIGELTDKFNQLLDTVVEITLKTKRDSKGEERQNCFINKIVGNALGRAVNGLDSPF